MPEPTTIQINKVEYVRKDSLPKLVKFKPGKNGCFDLGKAYFIRTVTHYLTGRLVHVDEKFNMLGLSEASWIADTGRFFNFLKEGTLNEVEPICTPIHWVAIGSIIDFDEWAHELPKVQK